MIKRLLFLAFVFSFAGNANAQIEVTLNPLPLLSGGLGAGIDVIVTPSISVELAGRFRNSTVNVNEDEWGLRGFRTNLIGKYYFNPKVGGDGFYGLAFLRYTNRHYEIENFTTSYDPAHTRSKFGIGVGIGYKLVSAKNIVFDVHIGVGRALSNSTNFEDSTAEEFVNLADWIDLMVASKLGVGYRFGGGSGNSEKRR